MSIWFGFIESGRVTACERGLPSDTYESALYKALEFVRNERDHSKWPGLVFCGGFNGSEFERFSVVGSEDGSVPSPVELARYSDLAACSIIFGKVAA